MIIVDRNGNGDFLTLQDAIDAIPAGNEDITEILMRRGIYREKVVIHRNRVRIMGEDVNDTIVTWNGCAKDPDPDGQEKGTFLSATLMTTGDDITIENLTIRNDAGDGREGGQAVAVYAAGDRGAWRNCRMIAHQDTLFCGPIRIPNTLADIGTRRGCAEAVTRVEDGHLTRPIRDVNIIGNGPQALRDISMVADNLLIDHSASMCGKGGQSVPVSQGLPTVLINKLIVG